MDDSDKIPAASPGVFFRFLCFLVGANAWKVFDPDDRASIIKTAFAMLLAAGWQAFAFAYLGHVALAPAGELRPEIILFAFLGAGFILIIDSLLFMEPSFARQGFAELQRGGLKLPKSIGDRIEGALFFLGRIVLAAAIVQFSTFALCSLFYQNDIKAILHADYQARNAGLIAAADQAYTANIAKADAALSNAIGARDAIRKQQAGFRATVVDPSGSEAEIEGLRERLVEAEDVSREANAALAAAETFAANELAGIQAAPGNSGKAGDGPVRRAAQERVEAARRHAREGGEAVVSARAALDAAQSRANETAVHKAETAQRSLSELEAQRVALDREVTAREAERNQLVGSRDQFINDYVTNSPGYVPIETGLLATIGTFGKLAGDKGKFSLMVIMEVVFFLVEMGAILSRSGTLSPSPYARQRAYDGYLGAVTAARNLSDEVEQIGSRPAREPTPVDEPDLFAGNDNVTDSSHADGSDTGVDSPLMSFFEGLGGRPKRGRPKGSKTRRVANDSVPPFFLPPPRKKG